MALRLRFNRTLQWIRAHTHANWCTNIPTELRDAANTGSQQGLFQRPQLQLGVRVLSVVHRRLLVLRVRTEVGRERQNTYGDRNQRTRSLTLNVWKELPRLLWSGNMVIFGKVACFFCIVRNQTFCQEMSGGWKEKWKKEQWLMIVFDLFTYEGFSHMWMVIKVHSILLSGLSLKMKSSGQLKQSVWKSNF